jgi:DNA-binding NtrC family response regulator/pSer/pThr/pTyr-binding forkhead associated (FHA) protein
VATPSTLRDESTLARSQAGGAAGLHLLVMGPRQFATFALPARGEVIVGRGDTAGVDIKLDDAKASRRHLRLHVGQGDENDVAIEDLGSANGTRLHDRKLAPGTRVRVHPGEAISVGALVLMVQPNRSARGASRRPLLSHAEFEGRVDWECARAEATGGTFSVARVRLPGGAGDSEGVSGDAIRAIDVVGRYGPGEIELLLPGIAGETARALAAAFARRLGGAAAPPRAGVASYPDDGRHAAALLARAGARARATGETDVDGADPADGGAITCVEESMRRVQALAGRAAAGDINVLILGETGVGKEVLARFIHAASARAARPMVSLNCAALSAALLESELFGHERGAFTGAAQAKAGLLETAPGGTVFLDEVGELPLALQAKLLRVIETREVLRVGGVRPRKIDVRFVAATNRDLEAEVARGGFRRDLYFRLNGMTVTIPPLRERPADIPLLARAFVAELARAGRPRAVGRPEISEPAMAVLRAHGWPGNVRELRNVIERALLLCDGATLLPQHLPQPVTYADAGAGVDGGATGAPTAPARTTAPDERARILAALAACGGNQSRAARQLGISRKVLIARLDSYGVARPRKAGPR